MNHYSAAVQQNNVSLSSMMSIIDDPNSNCNTFSYTPSHHQNTNQVVHPKHNMLCFSRDLVREKHKITKTAIARFDYRLPIKKLTEELVNHSDELGVTNISQEKLAQLLGCTIRSVRTYIAVLIKDGVITKEGKDGWQQTNTLVLVDVNTKLRHKEENFSAYLNNLNLRDLSTNIIHYEEYVSLSSKKESKTNGSEIPNSSPTLPQPKIDKPESIMRSEWEVLNEPLEEALQELIRTDISHDQRIEMVKTLKRLKAPLDEKKQLLVEVNRLANVSYLSNIGGFLVSRFRNMKRVKKTEYKPRDTFAELELAQKIRDEAIRRLAKKLIFDPLMNHQNLSNPVVLDTLSREYNQELACQERKIRREWENPVTELPPKTIWSERAYCDMQ